MRPGQEKELTVRLRAQAGRWTRSPDPKSRAGEALAGQLTIPDRYVRI